MKPISLFIIGLIILTSCTTGKNVYVRGFKASSKIEKRDSKKYVSNNNSRKVKSKHYKLSSTESGSKQANFETSVSPSLDRIYSSIASMKEEKPFVKDKLNRNVKRKNSVQYITNVDKETGSSSNSSKSSSIKSKDDTRVIPKVSIVGLIFTLLGFIFLVMGVLSYAYFAPIIAFILFMALAYIFFLTALFSGIKGMRRVKQYPDDYKGKGMAITSFFIGLAGSILLTFFWVVMLLMMFI